MNVDTKLQVTIGENRYTMSAGDLLRYIVLYWGESAGSFGPPTAVAAGLAPADARAFVTFAHDCAGGAASTQRAA
jgi:hypothetical protein